MVRRPYRKLVIPPSGDPYPLFTSLNRNLLPWHTGSGAWGPQVTIAAPTPPTTTRQVTVNSTAEFSAEASTDGTEITIGTSWSEATTVTVVGNDMDIIIPAGRVIGCIQVAGFGQGFDTSRIRIRGTTLGTHSGGRMGQLRTLVDSEDIIVDGVDVNGASGYGTGETYQAFRMDATRVAILNVRAIAPGYIWLGSAKHVFVGNSSLYHGAASRTEVTAAAGFVEGWGIRNTGGPFTIFQSDIRGTRYHNIRMQSVGGSGELLYMAGSRFVALAEGKCAWLWNNLNQVPDFGQGAIVEDNDIYGYAHVNCTGSNSQGLDAPNCDYTRVRNNRFRNGGNVNYTQSYLNSQEAGAGGGAGDHDWNDGGSNDFATYSSVPTWIAVGDPTVVPLPAGFTLIAGESPCTPMP